VYCTWHGCAYKCMSSVDVHCVDTHDVDMPAGNVQKTEVSTSIKKTSKVLFDAPRWARPILSYYVSLNHLYAERKIAPAATIYYGPPDITLKGQQHEIFGLWFSSWLDQYGPLIHALNYFRIREEIRKIMCISAVAGNAKSSSALSESALSRYQLCRRRRWDDVSAVSVVFTETAWSRH
jgi:hypothetical protein